MGDRIGKAAKILRMDFNIPAPGSAYDRAAGPLHLGPERGHHVRAHVLHPGAAKGAFQAGDTIANQALDMGGNADGRLG